MKSTIFTLADYVASSESSNKLTIVGTFDTILTAEIPFFFKPFGLALRLTADTGDYGSRHSLRLILRKSRGRKHIIDQPLEVTFKTSPYKQTGVSYQLAVNFGPIQFKSDGSYVIEVRSPSRVVCQTRLYVVKSKPLAKKQRAARRNKGTARIRAGQGKAPKDIESDA